MSVFDTNGDGVVDFAEFREVVGSLLLPGAVLRSVLSPGRALCAGAAGMCAALPSPARCCVPACKFLAAQGTSALRIRCLRLWVQGIRKLYAPESARIFWTRRR